MNAIIVDNHELPRAGLKAMLYDYPHVNLIAILHNVADLQTNLSKLLPELIIVDIHKASDIQTIKSIVDTNIFIKSIVIIEEAQIADLLLQYPLRIQGVLLKKATKQQLISAIDLVIDNKEYYCCEYENSIKELKQISIDILTPRERQILIYITNGHTNVAIANEIGISPKTVDSHRTRLMKKLKVNNIAGLIKYAFKNGYTS